MKTRMTGDTQDSDALRFIKFDEAKLVNLTRAMNTRIFIAYIDSSTKWVHHY